MDTRGHRHLWLGMDTKLSTYVPEIGLVPPQSCAACFGEEGISTKSLVRALKSFKPMSAPGPSGLRMNHLREALDTSSSDRNAWLETLKDWLSTSASGLLPAWCAPDLCAASALWQLGSR